MWTEFLYSSASLFAKDTLVLLPNSILTKNVRQRTGFEPNLSTFLSQNSIQANILTAHLPSSPEPWTINPGNF